MVIMKTLFAVITSAILIVAGTIIYFIVTDSDHKAEPSIVTVRPTPDVSEADPPPVAENETEIEVVDETKTVLGNSVNGHKLTAYHYGTGDREILLVGGIHGGYSWNTNLVAYELMDYLTANPAVIPDTLKVTVIPTLNPDGLEVVTGKTGRFVRADLPADPAATIAGRFNGNTVDLNRNFDCAWQAKGKWKEETVSGGETSFSEPEAAALRQYVLKSKPVAAVVWYSSAGGVFLSNCGEEALPETKLLAEAYGQASGYPVYKEFDFYEVTGDLANWLAKEGVPAISVLLSSAKMIEWDKNRAGINAIFDYYRQ